MAKFDPRDPKTYAAHKASANHSPLKKAMDAADGRNVVVVWCPFGCDLKGHDSLGFCPHVVGFVNQTQDGGEPPVGAEFEPLLPPEAGSRRRRVDGQRRLVLAREHRLERITSSYRVYHEGGYEYLRKALDRAAQPAAQPAAAGKGG